MATIRPSELPASAGVNPAAALVTDDGVTVEKATPLQVVDAAIPLASQAEAEAGVDNTKRVTPLRVKQAFDVFSAAATALPVADRTELAALDSTTHENALLTEDYRYGLFKWDDSDFSTEVALDTEQGVWVAPVTDPDGSSGAWVRQFSGDVDVRWFGASPSGITDPTDTAPTILAADAVARHLVKTLSFCGIFRVVSTMELDEPTHWRFEGTHISPAHAHQGSYLLKSSLHPGTALQINNDAFNTLIEGGGIVGDNGNTGDGVAIFAAGVTIRRFSVDNMGNDGFRIGAPTGDTTSNANLVFLDDCRSGRNGRDGIHVDDEEAAPNIDANAFQLNKPMLTLNGRHGFYANRSILGGTIIGGLYEANTDQGIYLDANCVQLVFVGGDCEANNGGTAFSDQIYEAVPFANRFIEVCVQGLQYNNRMQSGSFTPTVEAATGTAGTGTYSFQDGRYTITGDRLHFDIDVAWTAHTGSVAPMRVAGFPSFTPSTGSTVPDAKPTFVDCTGITIPAGSQPIGYFIKSTGKVDIYTRKDGTPTQLNLVTSGRLLISGSYPLQQYLSY